MMKYDNILELNFGKQNNQWFYSSNFFVLNANALQLGWILAFPLIFLCLCFRVLSKCKVVK